MVEQKLKVGILGATGMVGQRFISLLENHPWFGGNCRGSQPEISRKDLRGSSGRTLENGYSYAGSCEEADGA